MHDDPEERRKQDLKDFEFYSKRVRPTVGDLLRMNKKSLENNGNIPYIHVPRERFRGLKRPSTPASLADVHADTNYGMRGAKTEAAPSATANGGEGIWPLVAAAIVLVLLGCSGDINRMIPVLAL